MVKSKRKEDKTMKESIISLCVVIFLVILFVAACSTGGDPSDSTGENWIIAIIVLLAWLKGK